MKSLIIQGLRLTLFTVLYYRLLKAGPLASGSRERKDVHESQRLTVAGLASLGPCGSGRRQSNPPGLSWVSAPSAGARGWE